MTDFPDSLKVCGLEKIYTGGYLGLSRSDFETEGGFFVVCGASGSGKSTLLRLLAGLERPDCGSATFKGRDLLKLPPKERRAALFVNDIKSFKGGKSVFYNIAYPLMLRGASESEINSKVAHMSRKFGVYDYLYAKLRDVSENKRARVALARALIRDCDIYLLDNPFSGFADDERAELLSTLKKTVSESKGLTVYATDKVSECGQGDSCAVLYGGGVSQYGRLCDIAAFPQDLGTARMLIPDISVVVASVSEDMQGLSALGALHKLSSPPISDIYADKELLAAIRPDAIEIAASGIEAEVKDVYHAASRDVVELSCKGETLYAYSAPYALSVGAKIKIKADFGSALLYDIHSEKIVSKKSR